MLYLKRICDTLCTSTPDAVVFKVDSRERFVDLHNNQILLLKKLLLSACIFVLSLTKKTSVCVCVCVGGGGSQS